MACCPHSTVLWFHPTWFLHSLSFSVSPQSGKGFSTRGWPKSTWVRNGSLNSCLSVPLPVFWADFWLDILAYLGKKAWLLLHSCCSFTFTVEVEAFPLSESWTAFAVGEVCNTSATRVCTVFPRLQGCRRICAGSAYVGHLDKAQAKNRTPLSIQLLSVSCPLHFVQLMLVVFCHVYPVQIIGNMLHIHNHKKNTLLIEELGSCRLFGRLIVDIKI